MDNLNSLNKSALGLAFFFHSRLQVMSRILAIAIPCFILLYFSSFALAATAIPFTINVSKPVNVTGSPRIAIDVGGTTRYATYSSGTGTSTLIFTYNMVAGDVDLDGITIVQDIPTSTYLIDLNGGTIKDLAGNDLTPLTFTPPNTSNVKVNYPSLSMDFIADADGRYTLNGTAYNDLTAFLTAAGGSYTRPSAGTYFDSTGTLQTAASGIPRFDYDPTTLVARGILIEEQRTNSIRNSTMSGAAVGTLPTGWGTFINQGGGSIGISVVGTGVENGLNYVDIRTNGTTGTSTYIYIIPSNANHITAAVADNWNFSGYITRSAGSATGVASTSLTIYELNSSSGYTAAGTYSVSISASSLASQRKTALRTLTAAATAYVWPYIIVTFSNNTAIDVTYRIAGLQMEKGSAPTSYIPTTSAAVTRSADTLTIPTASWYNNSAGTAYLSAVKPVSRGVSSRFYSLYPSGSGEVSVINHSSAGSQIVLNVADSTGASVVGTSITGLNVGSIFKSAFAFNLNDFAASTNGGSITTDTSGSFPTMTTLRIGDSTTSNRSINSTIEKFRYYPSRVGDAQLQLLTQ